MQDSVSHLSIHSFIHSFSHSFIYSFSLSLSVSLSLSPPPSLSLVFQPLKLARYSADSQDCRPDQIVLHDRWGVWEAARTQAHVHRKMLRMHIPTSLRIGQVKSRDVVLHAVRLHIAGEEVDVSVVSPERYYRVTRRFKAASQHERSPARDWHGPFLPFFPEPLLRVWLVLAQLALPPGPVISQN